MCGLRHSHMIRKDNKKIPIAEVLEVMRITKEGKSGFGKFFFRGEQYVYSDRMRCFLNKGTDCIYCGRKGVYFLLEKPKGAENYHLALYALSKKGQQVLMTVDHVIPKSKGGRDNLDNQVPCCYQCNNNKGNSLLPLKSLEACNG